MRCLRLLLYFIVGLLLGAVSVLAFADYPAVLMWGSNGNYLNTSLDGTCEAAMPNVLDQACPSAYQHMTGFISSSTSPPSCTFSLAEGHCGANMTYTWSYALGSHYYCGNPPTLSANNGTATTCPGDPPSYCPSSGTQMSSGMYSVGASPNPPVLTCQNIGGFYCEESFSGSVTGRSLVGGVYQYYATGNYATTGALCDASTVPAVPVTVTSMPAPSCGTGQTLGSINGQYSCLDSTTGTPTNPNEPTTNTPSPSVSTDGKVTNGDGSTTETWHDGLTGNTITKNCDSTGANCTTTITYPPIDPMASYCKDNPKAAICSTSSGGDSTPDSFASPGSGSMPAAPTDGWYTSKYPQGLHGIWDTRKAELLATPLGAALANMSLPVGTGAVPVWTVNLWHVGNFDITMASWIWDVCGAIVLLSAAFACRRIIFGG